MKVFEIFNDTKYARTYLRLMNKAKADPPIDGYVERHHIHPKSLGGTNDKENLVKLKAREHFVAHLLLPKALIDKSHSKKMASALNRMLSDRYGNRYIPSSKLYDIARKGHSAAMTGRFVSAETREKISKRHKGKIISDEAKEKMSLAKIGKPGMARTPEWNAKVSASNTGKKASLETKEKMSLAKMGKPGSERTPEWRAKLSASQKLRWALKKDAKKNG